LQDHSRLDKVRLEQKAEVEKEVDEWFKQIRSASHSTTFVPVKRKSHHQSFLRYRIFLDACVGNVVMWLLYCVMKIGIS